MSGSGADGEFIPVSRIVLAGNEERYVVDVVRSTWISSAGDYVRRFEQEFAAWLGAPHAVSVCNGTCALDLALAALDIGPGDEVIVPSLTFAASVNAVLHVGAVPVLVDSAADHWNMDAHAWEAAVTPRTKAVMPVHLYGHPCDMAPILEIARRHGLFVIEDAAEAHGAQVLGRRVGTLGDIGAFSFYGNKIITCGEGGMCVTSDAAVDARMRMLRDHGMRPDRRYWHEEVGFNFRMTNLTAAVGVAQLEGIDGFLARRAEIARGYQEGLADVKGLRIIPRPQAGSKVDWLFCAFVEDAGQQGRDALLRELVAVGVDCRPTFYPVHVMPAYTGIRTSGTLANAERFGLTGINLPLHPGLTDDDVARVTAAVRDIAPRLSVLA
jgi:perosamine synthetase